MDDARRNAILDYLIKDLEERLTKGDNEAYSTVRSLYEEWLSTFDDWGLEEHLRDRGVRVVCRVEPVTNEEV